MKTLSAKMPRAISLTLLLVLLLVASSCARRFSHPGAHVSLGQELSDLKDARDKGALSEEEYAEVKSRILKRDGTCPYKRAHGDKKCCGAHKCSKHSCGKASSTAKKCDKKSCDHAECSGSSHKK